MQQSVQTAVCFTFKNFPQMFSKKILISAQTIKFILKINNKKFSNKSMFQNKNK